MRKRSEAGAERSAKPIGSQETSKKVQADNADLNAESALLPTAAHITLAGENIFLDLGFPPDEAKRLKEEVDREIARKKREVRYSVSVEGGVFVARCLDVEMASDGPTEAAAVVALKEALELYFKDSRQISLANSEQSSKSIR